MEEFMIYNKEELIKRVDEIYDSVVDFRRDLHMHPELSEQESRTASKVQEKLTALGISFDANVAGYGVSALIEGKNKKHAVGLRADMDALPILEKSGADFASKTEGVMHACGHDIHTAILVGVAEILSEIKDSLPGSVRLIFEPSEETIGGAKQMIDAGCLENPKVDSVLGLHVETTVPVGKVEFIPGPMNAASCEFYVTVKGKSCHGAHPSNGVDAIVCGCDMVGSIQTIITRRINPVDPALITIGRFHSGTKNNIIAGEAEFSGIIRTLNLENRELIKSQIKQICEGTAAAYGATCEVVFHDSYPSLENDYTLLEWITESTEEIIGRENITKKDQPSMGADDFSYFCHGSRGFYYNIGTWNKEKECTSYPIHNDQFNPDEECIKTGILTMVAGVLKILEEESKTW